MTPRDCYGARNGNRKEMPRVESTSERHAEAGSPSQSGSDHAGSAQVAVEVDADDSVSVDVSSCTGSLRLTPWAGAKLRVVGRGGETPDIDQQPAGSAGGDEKVIALRGHDCELEVPEGLTVELTGMHGDLAVVVERGVSATFRGRAAAAGASGGSSTQSAGAEGDRAAAPEGPRDWAEEFARVMGDLGRQLELQLGDLAPRFGQQLVEALRAIRWKTDRWQQELHRAERRADGWGQWAEEQSGAATARAAAASQRVEEAARRGAERLAARLQHEVEQAEARIQREIGRAQRHAGRGAARQERWAARMHGRRWAHSRAWHDGDRRAAQGAASREETLAVLRMLRDGKITPAQAAQLLAALQ